MTSDHSRSCIGAWCVKCGRRWPCPTRRQELVEEQRTRHVSRGWYVTKCADGYVTVDLVDGVEVSRRMSTSRDIAQAIQKDRVRT